MYERFTDRARTVMQLANQEAQRFNHEKIDSEHILIGLIKEGRGVAATVLENLRVDLGRIRSIVEAHYGPNGEERVVMGRLPQTDSVKKIIADAIDQARSLSCNYVGTEHLFLGILCQPESLAGKILAKFDLTLDKVRAAILEVLKPAKDEKQVNIALNMTLTINGQRFRLVPETPIIEQWLMIEAPMKKIEDVKCES